MPPCQESNNELEVTKTLSRVVRPGTLIFVMPPQVVLP